MPANLLTVSVPANLLVKWEWADEWSVWSKDFTTAGAMQHLGGYTSHRYSGKAVRIEVSQHPLLNRTLTNVKTAIEYLQQLTSHTALQGSEAEDSVTTEAPVTDCVDLLLLTVSVADASFALGDQIFEAKMQNNWVQLQLTDEAHKQLKGEWKTACVELVDKSVPQSLFPKPMTRVDKGHTKGHTTSGWHSSFTRANNKCDELVVRVDQALLLVFSNSCVAAVLGLLGRLKQLDLPLVESTLYYKAVQYSHYTVESLKNLRAEQANLKLDVRIAAPLVLFPASVTDVNAPLLNCTLATSN